MRAAGISAAGGPQARPDDDPRARRPRRRRPRRTALPAGAPDRALDRRHHLPRTWEGWLYLAAVQDAYSRRIVGWSMADHMRAELVVDALQMAVARRRPKPGLVLHSDQGMQFVSLGFGQPAATPASPARWAPGATLGQRRRRELLRDAQEGARHRRSWPTRRELSGEFRLHRGLLQPTARHSTLGMLSPADYENRTLIAARSRPRRYAARTPTRSDQQVGSRESSTLPAKRGNSKVLAGLSARPTRTLGDPNGGEAGGVPPGPRPLRRVWKRVRDPVRPRHPILHGWRVHNREPKVAVRYSCNRRKGATLG